MRRGGSSAAPASAPGRKEVEMAKAGYEEAVQRGDLEEQARWANQVGHLCKELGQYVEALKWFRKDYEISTKKRRDADASLPINLMPTCQSMGEIYFRLNDFDQALIYQKKHVELAEETDNLVEQQRATTQLGRTYVEIYERKDDFLALQNARQYLKTALDLAISLKENLPSRDSSSFVKELIDAYNNMGLLTMVIDDHNKASRYFHQALKICNEEELREVDDARSRLHHNLGRLYSEKRAWDKAKYHTQMDISICQRIPQPQGEAKGFINLGEIHFKRQKYEDANRCFERALQIAKSLEDEDDLVLTARKNLEVVGQAEEKILKLTVGEQQLKKLQRKRITDGKSSHKTEECKMLNDLIGLAEDLQAWEKHLKLAKRLKTVVKEMGDMEKLGDALEIVGESYYNLKDFTKAKKWHLRSWDLCKRIGHLEGQSVALINYGNALDYTEEWDKSLKAYKDAYEIAKSQGKTRMLSQQISALENILYCYFVRLERTTDAKAIQSKLHTLKKLKEKQEAFREDDEHCSETDNESETPKIPRKGVDTICMEMEKPNVCAYTETDLHDDDDSPLASFLPRKNLCYEGANEKNLKSMMQENRCTLREGYVSPGKEVRNPGIRNSRKRPRVVILDEEDNEESFASAENGSAVHALTGKEGLCHRDNQNEAALETWLPQTIGNKGKHSKVAESILIQVRESSNLREKVVSPSKDFTVARPVEHLETSELGSVKYENAFSISNASAGVDKLLDEDELQTSEIKRRDFVGDNGKSSSPMINEADSVLKQPSDFVRVHIGDDYIKVNIDRQMDVENVSTIDWLKQEIVHIYVSRNPAGPRPLIRHLALKGRVLQPLEKLASILPELDALDNLEAMVDCWVPVPIMDRYQLFCQLYQQRVNMKVMNNLMEGKELEEKISVSGCDLDDNSAWPLLMGLSSNGSFSHLDFSHNSIGNRSLQKIQEVIAKNNQPNLGLILDLHNNRLGAVSVVHICESPIIMSRLEVLNLSGNKLTDAAARYLTELIRGSEVLEVLKLEDCCLTTRSILKISSVLNGDCPLVKLSIGKNNPISSTAMIGLLEKLSSLRNFLELDITGISLDKHAVEAIGGFLKSSPAISTLMLGNCCIQNEGLLDLLNAIDVFHPRVSKLDISFNELNLGVDENLCSRIGSFRSLTHLNLNGNKLGEKGVLQISHMLSSMDCRLKVLMLERAQLDQRSILLVMKALQGNTVLRKLTLCGNHLLSNGSPRKLEKYASAGQSNDMDRKLEPKTPISCIHSGTVKSAGEQCAVSAKQPYPGDVDKSILPIVCENKQENMEGQAIPETGKELLSAGMVSDSEDDDEGYTVQEISFTKTWNAERVSGVRMQAVKESVVEELATALTLNEGLRFLDISDNGFSEADVDKLFVAWAAPSRWIHQPKRHVIGRVVQFSADGEQCPAPKHCCGVS